MKKLNLSIVALAMVFMTWSCGNAESKKEDMSKDSLKNANVEQVVGAEAAGMDAGQVEGQAEGQVESHSVTDMQASFKNINGETVSLKDLKGKVVVMNFWATWCPPCIKELPSLQKLSKELAGEKDIVFMAIEVDQDIDKAAKFMAKNKYTLPLYTLDSPLPAELASESIPVTVVLAKNGDIVGKHVGMMDFGSEKLKQGLIDLTKENIRK